MDIKKITAEEFESLKAKILHSNPFAGALIKDSAGAPIAFQTISEVLARYMILQSKAFYAWLKEYYAQDESALKRIVYFENDLNELRVRIYSFLDFNLSGMPVQKKSLVNRDFREFLKDFDLRLDMEQKFLFPLLSPKETVIAK